MRWKPGGSTWLRNRRMNSWVASVMTLYRSRPSTRSPLLSHAAKILGAGTYHPDRSEVGIGLGYRAIYRVAQGADQTNRPAIRQVLTSDKLCYRRLSGVAFCSSSDDRRCHRPDFAGSDANREMNFHFP